MEKNKKEQKNDEIDLLELFHKTWDVTKNFFNWIIRSILLFIVFLVRNSLYIAGFFILGGIIGLGISFRGRPYYVSDVVIKPNTLSVANMISYINRLHGLLKRKDTIELSKLLKIHDTITIQKIKDIQAFWIIDENKDGIPDYVDYKNKDKSDTSKRKITSRFDLRVEMYDYHLSDSVKSKIYNFIFLNPYITKLNGVRNQQTKILISKINSQIVTLDSLQDYDYFQKQKDMRPSGKNGQIVFLNEQKVQLYHGDIINLQKQRLALEKELAVYPDPITIIEDFTSTKKENPKSKYILKYGLWIGLLGILFLFLFQNRKSIKKYMEQD